MSGAALVKVKQALTGLPPLPDLRRGLAAVTGGAMLDSAGPPPFRVDRPFASAITDRVTDTILFLGTVHDPRG